MKTRIFTYASLILSAAALLSCQKLEEVNEPLVATGTHSVIVTTDATRTVNDDMHTYFEDGDKMTVIYKRDGSNNYHANEYTYSASSGQFTGDANLSSRYSYNWWGIYPYSSSNTSATSVSVSIPVSQTQVGNDSKAALAGEGFPLVGKTNALVKGDATPQFNVSNVATVLDFKITNGSATPLTVTKVEFTAPSGIAGTFSADLTKSTISWKAASSASKTVTLNVASGEAIANGAVAHFYAGAGPFSGAGSYTIEVTAKNAEGQTFVSSKTINGSLDCKSSTINIISHTFVPGAPVTEKTYKKVTTAPTDWSGTYLIVKESANVAFAYNQTDFKTPVTISNGTITTNDLEAYEVTVSESSLGAGKYDVKVGGQYLYKYGSSTDPTFFDSNISGNNQYFAEFSGSSDININFHRSGGSNNYFQYNDIKFCFGGTNTSTVQLYKLSDGGSEDDPDDPDEPDDPSVSGYELITSAPTDWSGNYLIVDANKKKVFTGETSKTNYYTLTSSDVEGNVITNSSLGQYAFTITKSGDNFYLQQGDKYYYVSWGSNSSTGIVTSSSQHAISFGGVLTNGAFLFYGVDNNKNQYLYVKSTEAFFKFGGSGNEVGVLLYKEKQGTTPATKQTQTLSFANSVVEWTLGDTYKVGSSYDAQSVSGANTTVTLTSSNASVATISDGKIKIAGEGTTTIIANAAEDDTYYGASASYTLKISPAPVQPSTKTYTKVSTITAGRNYVIAHSNNALQNNDGSAKAFSISGKVSNNTLTLTASDASSLEWKASASSSAKGEFKFANGGTYAYRETSTNVIKLSASAEVDRSAWTLSGTQLYNINSGGSKYYLNYSGTQWQATTGGSSAAITVYEENDGSTPDTPDTPTEKAYIKVTSAPSDWSGTYLIVDESARKAFDEKASSYASNVTISDGKIAWSETVAKYEIKVSPSSVSGMYELKTVDGKYMYSYNYGETTLNSSNKDNRNRIYYNSLAISGGNVTLFSTRGGDGSVNYFGYVSKTSDNPSGKNFGYKEDATTRTVQLYKLNEGSTPDTPDTPAQSSLNIENKQLAAYLDAVEKQPYFSNNTFGSYSSYYTSSLMKSNQYYSGSSSSNRLDQPVPVVITWSGNATKIEVFTSSSRTSSSRVASESFSSSSSASIYNLIPGQKYYYTATNGSTTVATGDFTPTGRRRMIKVSSSFDASHAANCRDFGGLPTFDGKHVKYGLIYRGSNIDGLSSDNDAKDVFLNTMKIKWDIDLRASNEKGSAPTLSGVSKGTQSYSASFDDNNLRSKTKVAKTLKEIIDAINKDTPEPVYIHCRIGSDRTGYICLLVEALIGVTQNYCDTDYEITSFTGNVTGTRFRVDDTYGGGMYKSGIKYFADFSGTTLHDKVYNFVTSASGLNISKTDVDKFISRMKE